MSSSSSPVLVLELQQSWLRLLPAGLLLLSGLSMPWLADISAWPLRVLLLLINLNLIGYAFRQFGYRHPARRLIGLSWQQNHEWRLQFAAGEPVRASLSSRSWLSPWLMCLKFRDEFSHLHQVMLWPSELSVSAWQQWQLRLRLEAGPATAAVISGLPQ